MMGRNWSLLPMVSLLWCSHLEMCALFEVSILCIECIMLNKYTKKLLTVLSFGIVHCDVQSFGMNLEKIIMCVK